jgi:hypothetical protein
MAQAQTLKAVYEVKELARMMGLSRQQIHRWLARERVQHRMVGRKVWVPLPAFRDAFPEFWDAALQRMGLTREAEIVCQFCTSTVQ